MCRVNPLTKGELSWTSYKKVPTAIVNGVQVNDSTEIINTIDRMLRENPAAPVAKATSNAKGAASTTSAAAVGSVNLNEVGFVNVRPLGQNTVEETKWREWVDTKLLSLLSPNIYRTLPDAMNSMDYLTKRNFPVWTAIPAKYVGALAMWGIGKSLKKKHSIPDGKEREMLYQRLDEWIDGMEGKPFMGGNVPNLADLGAYGILRAIKGLDTWRDAQANSKVAPWYGRMEAFVGPTNCGMDHRVGESPEAKAVWR